MKTFGINLIGYIGANLGLGHTAREFARALLAQGKPVAGLVPAPVQEYIRRHGLYRPTDRNRQIQ